VITRQIYDYALKHGKLKYKDLGGAREFKIDTSAWKESQGPSAITHTLPF
jgi:hypothetical protein